MGESLAAFREWDEEWMRRAIRLAQRCPPLDQPFGCIIVSPNGMAAAVDWGTGDSLDPTSHSETRAIQDVCKRLYRERCDTLLRGYTLVSTHQPCVMCAGAIAHSKLSRVVFGSYRSDVPHIFKAKTINCEDVLAEAHPPPVVLGGVLRKECVALFDGIFKWDVILPTDTARGAAQI